VTERNTPEFKKSLELHETNIPGLVWFDLTVNDDNRGSFTEKFQLDKMQALGISLGLFQKIRFLGQMPNYQIPARMNAADAVIMADRATFPMGLPLTVYEALVSRTPIIASHRPLLVGHFSDLENVLLFRAGNPKALADAIDMLLADQLLYARISRNAMASWTALQRSAKWGQMLDRWMSGAVQDRAWLAAQSYGVLMAKQVTDG